jgi:3-oxoadipate enol-lactonase
MTLRTRLGSRRMRRRAFLEMLIPNADLETANVDELAAQVASLIGRDLAHQPPILMKQLMAMARHDRFSRLRDLAKIPTLVLSAEHDRIATPLHGRTLADAIPGARFEEFPAASHGVIFQKPTQMNQILERFLNSVEKQNS